MSLKQIWRLLKETFKEWNDDKASRLAAALSYYTIFSLAPLLIIAIAIAGAVFGDEAASGEIVRQIQGLVGRDGAEVIQTALQNAQKPDTRNIASIISIGVLLFGASNVFAQIQDALNTIWEVQPKPGRNIWQTLRKRFLSFAMVGGVGFLLLVSLIVNTTLTAMVNYFSGLLPGFDFLWQITNFMISFVVITLLFALIYKVMPDAKIAWNDVWIGAAITSLLFVIGKSLLGLYLGNGSFGSAYGAAGSLIVLLAWINYAAQIIFFGAEFTQVYASKYGSHIVPDENSMRVPEIDRAKQGMKRRNSPRRN
ncbi:YihY/virulence factor BrkB family protein [Plectonema cf. radiosum LEGE 06105]|uniref:YihY/virulence factor BrkB family protein n=1 Tax=Plectonema cf. radiosum LEGE 06105 TaxID=945769 RepID=A0A8J7JYA1_9CYAN|nr:YihY/virulence factor BrkB family protein [Plectonema radiosum]MBE9211372.1 YihY/virulence factor BrkB family protein [Plectonema cf. radiosum LEGE 06105]